LGAKDIKIAGAEDKVSELFDKQIRRGAEAAARNVQWSTIPRSLLEIFAYGGLIVFSILVVVFEYQSAELSGLVLLYGLSALRLIPIFSTLVSNFTRLLNTFPAIDSLCTLLNDSRGVEHAPRGAQESFSWRSISLDNISFRYEGAERAAVQDVSATIERGRSYGVVGPSGSGKSTAVDLIVGLLEPTAGSIRVDDVTLAPENRRSWRHAFGYVAQRPFLLDASLRENVTFNFTGKVDQERLERAIELACLDQVVARLPEGLSSRLGEQGKLLSGGEQQRVAIARALYRGAEVLILDEATSSLDTLVEREIAASIERLRGVVTTIIVSHRLGLVRDCDEIWVFDNSRLAAKGSHEQLLSKSDLYRRMVK
jgi:ABC-type multidrug transport system fused ATPase/permease subunit